MSERMLVWKPLGMKCEYCWELFGATPPGPRTKLILPILDRPHLFRARMPLLLLRALAITFPKDKIHKHGSCFRSCHLQCALELPLTTRLQKTLGHLEPWKHCEACFPSVSGPWPTPPDNKHTLNVASKGGAQSACHF